MRITNSMLTNNFLADMQTNLNTMQKLQKQLTSGKLIDKASDDPVIAARSMQINAQLDANTQYKTNIKDAGNYLSTTDTALGQLGTEVARVRDLLVSSGNAGYDTQQLQSIKDEINQKISEISQTLNTNFDGKYIFGGTRGTDKPATTAANTVTTVVAYDAATPANSTTTSTVVDKGAVANLPVTSKNVTTDSTGTTTVTVENETTPSAAGTNTTTSGTVTTTVTTDGAGHKTTTVADTSAAAASPMISQTIVTDSTGTTTTTKTSTPSVTASSTTTHTNTELNYNVSTDNTANEMNMISKKLVTEVSQGVTIEYSVSASDVINFKDGTSTPGSPTNMIDLLKSIVNHLDGNNADGTAADSNAKSELTGSDLANITAVSNNILKLRSEVGAKENRMDDAKNNNETETENLTTILSKTEDIDVTEMTMKYATAQTVYMACLQTSAKVIQPTLMDYLS